MEATGGRLDSSSIRNSEVRKPGCSDREVIQEMKGRSEVTFGVYNVRGLDAGNMVDEMTTMLKAEDMDIVGIVESWRGREEGRRDREGLEIDRKGLEHQRKDLFGEDWVWVETTRTQQKSRGRQGGGVGLLVRAELGSIRKVGPYGEGCVWTEITIGGGEKIFVAVVYMRPGREHEGERNGVWKALEIGIEKARKRGSVVVLGDMNARFGETSSFLTQGDDVIEVRRNSIDTVVNGEGRNMISRLDGLGLVVLNGVKEKMEWTFDNGRGKSVVDIISTGKDSWQEWDSVKVARVDWMHSDHKLVKSVWRRSWALGKQS